MKPRQRVHYGWLVCLGCALLLFCTSGLSVNTFTVYQPYILEQNHFTNAQSSMILMVRNVFSLLSMLLAGIYYRHLSLRQGMGLAGLLTTAGFVFFALSRSYFAYCLSGAVIGLAYGVGTMIPISIVLEHWFVQKRTMAISLCSAVTGLSTLGIPTLLTELIERQGLRFAFLMNAAVELVHRCRCGIHKSLFINDRLTVEEQSVHNVGEDIVVTFQSLLDNVFLRQGRNLLRSIIL